MSRRRPLSLLSGFLLLTAQAVTPALALTATGGPGAALGASALAANCAPGDTGITARGGITDSKGMVRELETGQVVTQLPKAAQGAAPADFSVSVGIWFHVITDGSIGYLSPTDLANQVRVMNATFGGRESFAGTAGGSDTGFSWYLAGYDYTDNAKWYWMKSTGAEHEMKQALRVGGDNLLNVYTGTAGAYLGWAYLPSITDSNQAYLDGIVLDWESLPNVSDRYLDRYDEGETLTHEAGHWLNLEHTFYNRCKGDGDFVDDTPADATPTSGCPIGKDTCTAPGADPIHNYIDYAYDDCYTQFTPGQVQRMADAWLYYRAS